MTYMYELMKTQMVPKPKRVEARIGDQTDIDSYRRFVRKRILKRETRATYKVSPSHPEETNWDSRGSEHGKPQPYLRLGVHTIKGMRIKGWVSAIDCLCGLSKFLLRPLVDGEDEERSQRNADVHRNPNDVSQALR
jgi:hypothetical protein